MTKFQIGDRVVVRGTTPYAGLVGTVRESSGYSTVIDVDDCPEARALNGGQKPKAPWYFTNPTYPIELLPSGPDRIAEMFS